MKTRKSLSLVFGVLLLLLAGLQLACHNSSSRGFADPGTVFEPTVPGDPEVPGTDDPGDDGDNPDGDNPDEASDDPTDDGDDPTDDGDDPSDGDGSDEGSDGSGV